MYSMVARRLALFYSYQFRFTWNNFRRILSPSSQARLVAWNAAQARFREQPSRKQCLKCHVQGYPLFAQHIYKFFYLFEVEFSVTTCK